LWTNQIGFLWRALFIDIQCAIYPSAKPPRFDAMVWLWITLGCYGLVRFLLIDGLWRWYIWPGFFMGSALLPKGVVFCPLLMFTAFLRY